LLTWVCLRVCLLLQVWTVKLPAPGSWVYPQARMQHFMQLLGSSVISFVQVGQQLYPVSKQQLLRLHVLLQLADALKAPAHCDD
jgi:hypothetical protein